MLQQNGVNAVGLNGMDAMTIRAVRKKRLLIINERGRKQAIDGGYTGKISAVNTGLVQSLLDAGITPVISPIAAGEQYEFLNIDGDRTAAHVAGALGSDRVIFVTDVGQPAGGQKDSTKPHSGRGKADSPPDRPRNGKKDPGLN